jgi:hypothetical protein
MPAPTSAPDGTGRNRRALPIALALLAVSVRLVHLQVAADTALFSLHRTFPESDMYMFDQWARHIAAGDWLGREVYHPLYQWQLAAASPASWQRQYGLTAVFYKAPFYAYLIALLQRFGDPMLPLAVLQILASAGSVALLFSITARVFGRKPAAGAALLLALYGPDVHYSVAMLRGPWIVLVSLLVTHQLLRLRERPSAWRGFSLGLAVAAALLVNEGFVLLPLLVLAAVAAMLGRAAPTVAVAGLLGFGLGFSPVIVHNVSVRAPWAALAVTGSTVYAIFNAAGSSPFFFDIRPSVFLPLADPDGRLLPTALACLRSFEGPLDVAAFYLRKAAGLVVPFENPDNVNFYYAALKDPVLAWLPSYAVLFPLAIVGFALAARRWRRLIPLLPSTLSLLSSMLLTLPLSRYRSVLAVHLMPFAGLALASGWTWIVRRQFPPLVKATGAALLVWITSLLVQHMVVFAGRDMRSWMYRSPEFLLGVRFYADQRRFGTAAGEALALASRNPDPAIKASALVTAARLQAARGDGPGAADSLMTALRVKAYDPALLIAAGDLYAGPLANPVAARECYRRAAALRPQGPLGETLRQRLGGMDNAR